MNRKERVETLLQGGTPDRVPVVPAATYSTAYLKGITVKAAASDPELMAECLFEGQKAAGSDGLYLGWGSSFNIAAAALGCGLTDPEDDVPAVDRPLFAGGGFELDRLDPALIDEDEGVAIGAAAGKILREMAGDEWLIFAYVPGPFTLAGLLRGAEQILMDAVEAPEKIAALVDKASQASLNFARSRAAAGADILVVADPMASCSLISPKMFRNLAKAPLTKVLEAIKTELEKVPSLHICGQTTPILADLAETGPQIIELDHAVDLAKARETLPEEIIIQGNIDPALLLAGPPAEIKRAAIRCQEKIANHPFILSSGCEIALKTPLTHYQAMHLGAS